MFDELEANIRAVIKPLIEEQSLELFALEIKRPEKVIVISILADKPQGGISLDECTLINRQINVIIEEQQLIEKEYVVEVSSPGVDRPLRTKKDFLRVLGRSVHIELNEDIDQKAEISGIIKEVSELGVTLNSKINTVTVPFEKITQGTQII